MKNKENNKQKKITPEYKATILLEYIREKEQIPKTKEEYKDVKIGIFWANIKRGRNKEIYDNILSQIHILKSSYEEFIKKCIQ